MTPNSNKSSHCSDEMMLIAITFIAERIVAILFT